MTCLQRSKGVDEIRWQIAIILLSTPLTSRVRHLPDHRANDTHVNSMLLLAFWCLTAWVVCSSKCAHFDFGFNGWHRSDTIRAGHTEIEPTRYSRKFANSVIGLLSLWAIYAVSTSLAGVPIVFPISSGGETGVPMSRLVAIRHAVFVTFAFYGIMHLLQGS